MTQHVLPRRRALRAARGDEGFALIELLVVMVIIGILAGIAVPIFLNQRKKSYDVSVKSDLNGVANEMKTYYSDNQTYAVPMFGSAAPAASGTATTFSGAGTIGADPVTLSKNVSVTLYKYGVNGFCAYGSAGSAGSNIYYVYDSTAGGLSGTSQATAAAAQGTCTGSY